MNIMNNERVLLRCRTCEEENYSVHAAVAGVTTLCVRIWRRAPRALVGLGGGG